MNRKLIQEKYDVLRRLLEEVREIPDVSPSLSFSIILPGSVEVMEERLQSPLSQRILTLLDELLELSFMTDMGKRCLRSVAEGVVQAGLPSELVLSVIGLDVDHEVWGIFDPTIVRDQEYLLLAPRLRDLQSDLIYAARDFDKDVASTRQAVRAIIFTCSNRAGFVPSDELAAALRFLLPTCQWIDEWVNRFGPTVDESILAQLQSIKKELLQLKHLAPAAGA